MKLFQDQTVTHDGKFHLVSRQHRDVGLRIPWRGHVEEDCLGPVHKDVAARSWQCYLDAMTLL